jgi:flagellar motor protein MotB
VPNVSRNSLGRSDDIATKLRDLSAGVKEQLQKSIREVPKFDKLLSHIDMTVTNEGLCIELTESATGTFFESGSAKMSGDGSDLRKTLAQELGKLPSQVAIEGHTDSKPYPPTAAYTNWELSADRANAARRLQYREKPAGAPRETRREHRPRNPRRGTGNKNPPAEASPPRRRRNRAEPSGRKTAIVSVFRMSLQTCACWPVWRRNFSGARLRPNVW